MPSATTKCCETASSLGFLRPVSLTRLLINTSPSCKWHHAPSKWSPALLPRTARAGGRSYLPWAYTDQELIIIYARCTFLQSSGVYWCFCACLFCFDIRKATCIYAVCAGCKFQSLPVAKHKLNFHRCSSSVKSICRVKIHLGQMFLDLAPNPTLTKKKRQRQRQPLLCPQLRDLGLQICYIIEKNAILFQALLPKLSGRTTLKWVQQRDIIISSDVLGCITSSNHLTDIMS